MAITYPLALPTHTGIQSVNLRANDIVGMNMSPFSASQQVYKYTGQFWEADISLPPMKRADAEYWITFLMKLNGAYGTFLLGDPSANTARGVATGSPLVNGASQTGYELITDGWTPDTTESSRQVIISSWDQVLPHACIKSSMMWTQTHQGTLHSTFGRI